MARPKKAENVLRAAGIPVKELPAAVPRSGDDLPTGEEQEISLEQAREVGAVDLESARRNTEYENIMRAREAGIPGVSWGSIDGMSRYNSAIRLKGHDQIVRIKRVMPSEAEWIVPLGQIPTYIDFHKHVTENYWKGEAAAYEWAIHYDGALQSAHGRMRLDAGPNYARNLREGERIEAQPRPVAAVAPAAAPQPPPPAQQPTYQAPTGYGMPQGPGFGAPPGTGFGQPTQPFGAQPGQGFGGQQPQMTGPGFGYQSPPAAAPSYTPPPVEPPPRAPAPAAPTTTQGDTMAAQVPQYVPEGFVLVPATRFGAPADSKELVMVSIESLQKPQPQQAAAAQPVAQPPQQPNYAHQQPYAPQGYQQPYQQQPPPERERPAAAAEPQYPFPAYVPPGYAVVPMNQLPGAPRDAKGWAVVPAHTLLSDEERKRLDARDAPAQSAPQQAPQQQPAGYPQPQGYPPAGYPPGGGYPPQQAPQQQPAQPQTLGERGKSLVSEIKEIRGVADALGITTPKPTEAAAAAAAEISTPPSTPGEPSPFQKVPGSDLVTFIKKDGTPATTLEALPYNVPALLEKAADRWDKMQNSALAAERERVLLKERELAVDRARDEMKRNRDAGPGSGTPGMPPPRRAPQPSVASPVPAQKPRNSLMSFMVDDDAPASSTQSGTGDPPTG